MGWPPVTLTLATLLAFSLTVLTSCDAAATNTTSDNTHQMGAAALKAHKEAKKRYDTAYADNLKKRGQSAAPAAYGVYWGWVIQDGLLCWDNSDCTWIDEYLECQDTTIEGMKENPRWTGYDHDTVKGRCQCSDISYFYPVQLACRFAWWQHLLFVLAAVAIAAVLVAIAACFLLPLFVVKQGDKEELLRQASTTTHEGTKKEDREEEEGGEESAPAIEKPEEKKEYPSTYGEALKNYKTTMAKVPHLARQESKHLSKTFPKT